MNRELTSNSIMYIDLQKVKGNIEKIRRHIGPDVELMVTMKSYGYGHGMVEPALYMAEECGVKKFATAALSEALELREAGIKCMIMTFGGVPHTGVSALVANDIVATLYDYEFAKLISEESVRQNKITKCHIKIDTGMRRIGVHVGAELQDYVDFVKALPGIEIEGALTQLASPDEPSHAFNREQLAEFDEAIIQMKASGLNLKYLHTANSGATVRLPASYYNMVRPAALIWGYDTSPGEYNRLGLETVISWKAYVTNVRDVAKGESASYSKFFKPQCDSKVAIMSFGTGDGYLKHIITKDASKNPQVIINGRKCPIIAINMDQTFADVTNVPVVKIGDEVWIFGKQGDVEVGVMDVSAIGGASDSHILGNLTSTRPYRVYLK